MNMPLQTHSNGVPQAWNVDNRLREFFRSQMPDPWPELDLPQPSPMARPRYAWFRSASRLALAASILLFLAGYLTLGSFFPRTGDPTDLERIESDIANRPRAVQISPERMQTRRGADVLLQGEIRGKNIIINVQELPPGND